MANNQIKIGVGFQVDRSGLNELKKSLNEIQHMKPSDIVNAKNIDEATGKLKDAQSAANILQDALTKSFNTKLGTSNIATFNKEIEKSGFTISQLQGRLYGAGAAGRAAFDSMIAKLLTTNKYVKQTSKLIDKMAETFANTVRWSITSSALQEVTGAVQKAYSFTKQLDGSLNDIRIVTEKSADQMARFAVEANKAAKQLGASTKAYADASLIYYQQGLSDQDTAARAAVTTKVSNVTGAGTEATSEQLTAIWNGYKVSAQEAELYIDKVSAVAASTAADLEELSLGMSKVASAANIMGVDIDQLNAQLATIVSVTRQAPESIGTALKTVYARMSDIQAGIDGETSLDEYTKQMAEMGVSVLDATGRLRDMGEVVEQIGNNWENLTRNQQVSLAQTIAGTRQYNNMMALFDNWDMYKAAKGTSQRAAGTLQKQQDIYMESTEAHLAQLRAEAEDLYQTMLDPKGINTLIDALQSLVEVADHFAESIGGGAGVLRNFGAIAFNVFDKKIGSVAARGVKNVMGALDGGAREREEEKTRNALINNGVSEAAVNKIIELRNEQLKLEGLLTQEDEERFKTLTDEILAIDKKNNLLKEQQEILKAVYNAASESDQITDDKLTKEQAEKATARAIGQLDATKEGAKNISSGLGNFFRIVNAKKKEEEQKAANANIREDIVKLRGGESSSLEEKKGKVAEAQRAKDNVAWNLQNAIDWRDSKANARDTAKQNYEILLRAGRQTDESREAFNARKSEAKSVYDALQQEVNDFDQTILKLQEALNTVEQNLNNALQEVRNQEEIEETIGRKQEKIKANQVSIDNAEDKIDTFMLDNDTQQALLGFSEAINALETSGLKLISEEELEKLKNAVSTVFSEARDATDEERKTSKAVKDAGKIVDINDEVSAKELEEAFVALQKIDSLLKEQDKILQENVKDGDKIVENLEQQRQAQKDVNEQVEAFNDSFNIDRIASTITDITGKIANLAAGFQTLANIDDIWNNENLTGGEKFLQTLTNIGMALPMIISGLSTLSPILAIINAHKKASQALDAAKIVQNAILSIQKDKELSQSQQEAAQNVINKLSEKELAEETWKTVAAKVAKGEALDESEKDLLEEAAANQVNAASETLSGAPSLGKTLKGAGKKVGGAEKAGGKLVGKGVGALGTKVAGLVGAKVAGGAALAVGGVAVAAVAALAVGIYALVKAYNKEADALKKAQEVRDKANESLQEAQSAYGQVQQQIDRFNKSKDAFEGLTKGTKEWTEALLEANNATMELLKNHEWLAAYITTDKETGAMTISDEGISALQRKSQNEVLNAQNAVLRADMGVRQAQYAYDQVIAARDSKYGGSYIGNNNGIIDDILNTEGETSEEKIRNYKQAQKDSFIKTNTEVYQNYENAEEAAKQYDLYYNNTEGMIADLADDINTLMATEAANAEVEKQYNRQIAANTLQILGYSDNTSAVANFILSSGKQVNYAEAEEAYQTLAEITEGLGADAKELFYNILGAGEEIDKDTIKDLNVEAYNFIMNLDQCGDALAKLPEELQQIYIDSQEAIKNYATNFLTDGSYYGNTDTSLNDFGIATGKAYNSVEDLFADIGIDKANQLKQLFNTAYLQSGPNGRTDLATGLAKFNILDNDNIDLSSATLYEDILKEYRNELNDGTEETKNFLHSLKGMSQEIGLTAEDVKDLTQIISGISDVGDTISEEEFVRLQTEYEGALGSYFTQMLDGTYALTTAAETFYEAVANANKEQSKAQITATLDKINRANQTMADMLADESALKVETRFSSADQAKIDKYNQVQAGFKLGAGNANVTEGGAGLSVSWNQMNSDAKNTLEDTGNNEDAAIALLYDYLQTDNEEAKKLRKTLESADTGWGKDISQFTRSEWQDIVEGSGSLNRIEIDTAKAAGGEEKWIHASTMWDAIRESQNVITAEEKSKLQQKTYYNEEAVRQRIAEFQAQGFLTAENAQSLLKQLDSADGAGKEELLDKDNSNNIIKQLGKLASTDNIGQEELTQSVENYIKTARLTSTGEQLAEDLSDELGMNVTYDATTQKYNVAGKEIEISSEATLTAKTYLLEDISKNIDKFKKEVEEALDTASDSLLRKYSEFIQSMKKEEYGELGLVLTDNFQVTKNNIDTLLTKINELQNKTKYDTTSKDFSTDSITDKTALDTKDAELQMQELLTQLMDEGLSLQQAQEAYEANILNYREAVNEAYSNSIELLEDLNNALEHQHSLTELIYGDEAYKKVGDYYEQTLENTLAIGNLKKTQMENDKAYLEKVINSGDKDLIVAAEEAYRASSEAYFASMTESAQAYINYFENEMTQSIYDFERSLIGSNDSLSSLKEEYNWINSATEDYLSVVDAAFGVADIEHQFNQAITSAASLTAQKKLNEAQAEELALLRSKDKLTQYDLDRAKKKLEITQAEIALQEAQQNKSQMRLVRGADGSYNYQYVADQNEIEEKEADLRKLQQELITLDENQAKSSIDKVWELYQEMIEKMKAASTEEEAMEIYTAYSNRITEASGAAMDAINVLKLASEEAMGDLGEDFNFAEAFPWANTDFINEFVASGAEGFTKIFDGTMDEIRAAIAEKSEVLTGNEGLFSSMQSAMNDHAGIMATINTRLKEELNKLTGQDSAISALISGLSTLKSTVDSVSKQIADTVNNNLGVLGITKSYNIEMTEEAGTKKMSITPIASAETGGYTGAWGPEGKFLLAHEKELILNKMDTANILAAVDMVRALTSSLDASMWTNLINTSFAAMDNYMRFMGRSGGDTIDQNVHITAEFPNVENKTDIEDAFNDLINLAAQHAYRDPNR